MDQRTSMTIDATIELEKRIALALLFAALTVIGANLRVPLSPVPVTMQVFFVLLSGLMLGPVWGPASQMAYITLGVCGAPVFAAPPHAGAAVLLGPTGGYLVGFIAASAVAGLWKAGGDGGRFAGAKMLLASAGAVAALYAIGTGWLAVWLSMSGREAGLAYELGVRPFVLADLVKGIAATMVATSLSSVGRSGSPWKNGRKTGL